MDIIEQLQKQGLYKLVFLAVHGDWPHLCHFCGKEVDGHATPYDAAAAVIHHLDLDSTNHDPQNLVPTHQGCHTTYHKFLYWSDKEKRARQGQLSRGRKASEATRQKMSQSQVERFERDGPNIPSAEGRARISKAQIGHTLPPEAKARISTANSGRIQPPEERARRSKAALGRKSSQQTRDKIREAKQTLDVSTVIRIRALAAARVNSSKIVKELLLSISPGQVRRIVKGVVYRDLEYFPDEQTLTAVSNEVACRPDLHQQRRKLTIEQQAEVCRRYFAGDANQVKLAAEYGVSQAYISKLVRAKERITSEGEL